MILRTRGGAEVELRAAEWGSSAIPPYPGWSPLALASPGQVTGLPAVTAAIRLVSDTIASLPLLVYAGRGADRVRAPESWQWDLLHDEDPGADLTTVNVMSDIATSIEAAGDAFCLKSKDRQGRVIELLPLNPQLVQVKRVAGEKRFSWRDETGAERQLTGAQVLHIRGFSLEAGALRGMSPLTQHRLALSGALSLERFQSAFFRNSARLGGVIKVPGRLTEAQALELLESFESVHAGPEHVGSTGVLHSGAEWQQLGISQTDAQYVETRKLAIADVARIFRVPLSLLDDAPDATAPAAEAERFLKFSLGPRLKTIERGLAADVDLFAGTDLYPEFLVDALLRASTRERYEAYRAARQAGWLSPNEIRALENYPPVAGGDEIQLTPVGGAPNLQDDAEDVPQGPQDGNGAMDEGRGMGGLLAALRRAPAPPAVHLRQEPITVNLPAPVVNVAAPNVTVAAAEVNVPAPVVNVPAPVVNVAAADPPRITVRNQNDILMPAPGPRSVSFQRGPGGQLVGAEIEDG